MMTHLILACKVYLFFADRYLRSSLSTCLFNILDHWSTVSK